MPDETLNEQHMVRQSTAGVQNETKVALRNTTVMEETKLDETAIVDRRKQFQVYGDFNEDVMTDRLQAKRKYRFRKNFEFKK